MAAPFATADLAHMHSGPISAAPFLDVVGWLDDPLEWMHIWAWLRKWFAVKRCPFLNGSGDHRFANLNFINNPGGRGGFSNDLLVLSLVVATTVVRMIHSFSACFSMGSLFGTTGLM